MNSIDAKTAYNGGCKILVSITFIIGCLPVSGYSLEPPPITAIEEFFVFGEGPTIPDDWHLVVDGAVENALSLTLEELMQYPARTEMATLECYFPLGPWLLVGNANWTGVALNTIIQQANPLDEAISITFHAVDDYSQGTFSLAKEVRRRVVLFFETLVDYYLWLAPHL